MHMQKSTFTCVRDGLTIRGTLFSPSGENLPIAIVCHGFMADRTSVTKYARRLASWGYAAFCFDFNGGCIRGKSDGKTTDMTVLTETADLLSVIDYAKSLAFTDSQKLILMGCSQGGFVSALTAARLGEQVSALILFYPALCIPDDARRGQMMFASFDPLDIPQVIPCGPMKLGHDYPACVLDMDPFAEISAYTGPVLLIHGDKDPIVALSYAVRARRAYLENRTPGQQKLLHLKVIKGAGHGFSPRADRTAICCVRQFLAEQ